MTRAFAHAHRRLRPQAAAAVGETSALRRRADWRDLADKARAACLGLAAADADFALHFAHLTAVCGRGEAPFENASDRLCAEALRTLCRAWLHRPAERRAGLSAALGAAAQLIDQLLTEEQDRAAQAWKRRLPEDER